MISNSMLKNDKFDFGKRLTSEQY